MAYNDVWGRTQNRVMLDGTIPAVKGNSRDRKGGPTCVFLNKSAWERRRDGTC
jgi:hypothetical protein